MIEYSCCSLPLAVPSYLQRHHTNIVGTCQLSASVAVRHSLHHLFSMPVVVYVRLQLLRELTEMNTLLDLMIRITSLCMNGSFCPELCTCGRAKCHSHCAVYSFYCSPCISLEGARNSSGPWDSHWTLDLRNGLQCRSGCRVFFTALQRSSICGDAPFLPFANETPPPEIHFLYLNICGNAQFFLVAPQGQAMFLFAR